VKSLVAALKEIDIDEAIKSAALPVAPAAATAPAAAPAEEKKEEEEKEEEEEKVSEEDIAAGLGALFG
jgi:large subunit ribosomal protein L12